MQLMLELTRRCDMQCPHCLRGDAEGKDMTSHVLRMALHVFKGDISSFAFGGGEAIMKASLLQMFRQEVYWSGMRFDWIEPMWIVSNGKRLLKQQDNVYYSTYDEENEEDIEPERTDIADELVKISEMFPVTLAISTDQFHPGDAKMRYFHAQEIFRDTKVEVCSHGPKRYDQLIGMGRYRGGKALEVSAKENNLYYVTIHGDIYTSCDLSYKFMDSFKDSALCIGNVLTDTYETIHKNLDYLEDLINFSEYNSIDVAEDDIDDLTDLVEVYEEYLKTEKNEYINRENIS